MFAEFINSSLLLHLLFFIIWSGFLYAMTLVIVKITPQTGQWSRFWLAGLIVSLVPLLPFSFLQENVFIPDDLIQALGDSQPVLLQHSNALVNQVTEAGVLQTAANLILIMLGLVSTFSMSRFIIGFSKINQFVSIASPITDLSILTPQQQEFIATKNIHVLTTVQRVSPFVFGFFRVKLLLPRYVFTMPEQQRFLLIEHELMHIKRQDPKAVILFRLCACLFYFNPFIRYLEKRFLQTMELNCDNAILANAPENKLSYARALIASLKLGNSTLEGNVITYFSSPQLTKSDLEDRIKAAMATQKSNQYGLLHRLILVVMALCTSSLALAAKPFLSIQDFDKNHLLGIAPVLGGRISSDYNKINDFRGNKRHKAIDFTAPIGTDVVASFSGRVIIADDITLHQNFGNVVLIEHKDQIQSLYAHLNDFTVESGQYIFAGEKIGTVGVTGRVTGPHLHFEVLEEGKHTDPSQYINL
jgi:murein DD-endopeptidase MepM/ murein hydrolase activator NlpD